MTALPEGGVIILLPVTWVRDLARVDQGLLASGSRSRSASGPNYTIKAALSSSSTLLFAYGATL
jgi:hypothetical protein